MTITIVPAHLLAFVQATFVFLSLGAALHLAWARTHERGFIEGIKASEKKQPS